MSVPTGGGQRKILDQISLELQAPKTAVLGLNGSGKSTFLRLFNGLDPISSGQVLVHGVSVADHLAAVRSRVGLLFSDPAAQLLMPTVIEDVELSLQGIEKSSLRREAALEVLAQRGLEERAFDSTYTLSGGEKQLVALSTLLAVEPKVLLLDEPTTLLDLRNKYKLMDLLESLPQQQLISTHDLELAASCQEAIIIHRGQLLAQGPAEQMIDLYRNWCAHSFPAGPQEAGPQEADAEEGQGL